MILKFYIRRLIFLISDLLVRVLYSCSGSSDRVLVVRLDAIGDYVLFRNFLADIKASDKYKHKKITLVGNIAWREIAEFFDSDVVDDFIWIDRTRFVRNIHYRFNKLSEIRSCCPSTVIQPTYSREFFLGDSVVDICSAREKIGSVGDCSNIKSWQKKYQIGIIQSLSLPLNRFCLSLIVIRNFFLTCSAQLYCLKNHA